MVSLGPVAAKVEEIWLENQLLKGLIGNPELQKVWNVAKTDPDIRKVARAALSPMWAPLEEATKAVYIGDFETEPVSSSRPT